MNLVPTLFPVMPVMVVMWLAMIIALFMRLKSKHSEKYKEISGLCSFPYDAIKLTSFLLVFLFKREHKGLGDNSLSFLSDFMLVFSAIYLLLFFVIILNGFFYTPFDVNP